MPEQRRRWTAGRPVDIRSTLGPLLRGRGDPAHRAGPDGSFWWACHTPDGPGTLVLRQQADAVDASAWGVGASWLLAAVPVLLGADDDWTGFDAAAHPLLASVWRRRPGLRLPHTGLVLEALIPAVLEQRVTGREARRAWRGLCYRFGQPAPGPLTELRVPPTPSALLDVPTWDWHRLGVDISRQRTIRAAATVAPRLEECASLPSVDALARLRGVPGVGAWTAAEVAQRAWGDPDAVSVGDYHIHDQVVHALTGRPRGDDEEMIRLLEPWRGHRQRVVRLVEVSGVAKPRFGPRYSPIDTRAM
jgi:3-methyladenine DNA glycosylase/8-oxoguanine DNA glycosylase